MDAERQRIQGFGPLEKGLLQASDWYLWGPYLTERQWGTVREDYSVDGSAWDYLPHDHARSRAYRWGEDGLAGFCDIEQRLCRDQHLGRQPVPRRRDHPVRRRQHAVRPRYGRHRRPPRRRPPLRHRLPGLSQLSHPGPKSAKPHKSP
jgi:hypothetical protein